MGDRHRRGGADDGSTDGDGRFGKLVSWPSSRWQRQPGRPRPPQCGGSQVRRTHAMTCKVCWIVRGTNMSPELRRDEELDGVHSIHDEPV